MTRRGGGAHVPVLSASESAAIPSVSYLAGFLDADGCFTSAPIRGGNARSPRLNAVGVHPAPLDAAKARWGGSMGCYGSGNAAGRDLWSWTVSGLRLDAALDDLDAHLLMKRPEAQVIRDWRCYGGRFRDEKGRWRAEHGPDAWKSLHEELTRLNSRGADTPVPELPTELPTPPPEYLAGMVDGDGCIQASRTGKISLAICTVPPLVPTVAHMRWGGTLGQYGRRQGNPNARPAWVWRISGRSAVAAIEELRPHLLIKRAQASVALGLADLVDVGNLRTMTDLARSQRDVLVDALSALNRRGKPSPTAAIYELLNDADGAE